LKNPKLGLVINPNEERFVFGMNGMHHACHQSPDVLDLESLSLSPFCRSSLGPTDKKRV
jgi:hypothetical protein